MAPFPRLQHTSNAAPGSYLLYKYSFADSLLTRHLQSSDIHLTPQRAHSAKPRAWERQPRATTQRCGKTKRVWKRPLQQRQGPNGQTSQNNIDATASLQAFDRTPQKALKKARITNNGAARAHADNGHVGSKVITRDWIRNRMPRMSISLGEAR